MGGHPMRELTSGQIQDNRVKYFVSFCLVTAKPLMCL